jgi:hypothetical protein
MMNHPISTHVRNIPIYIYIPILTMPYVLR